MADQRHFAALSGDFNPLHMDETAARRSVIGAAAVHGVHVVLWGLEALSKSSVCPDGFQSIDVQFRNPVLLGDDVKWEIQSASDDEMRLRATVGIRPVITMRLGLTKQSIVDVDDSTPVALQPEGQAIDLAFAELEGQAGQVPFAVDTSRFAKAFPHASSRVGASRLREFAACSRLVGMICPGLRSVFGRLTLKWCAQPSSGNLHFEVINCDSRFHRVEMRVHRDGMEGTIEAYSPAASRPQPTAAELAAIVAPTAFHGQRALVVGGSRGLGELTAKLLSIGGADVVLTYASGRDEADKVAAEIQLAGGSAMPVVYDATKPASSQIAAFREQPFTHLYYFATGRISKARTKTFDAQLVAEFMQFYVYGFFDLCQSLTTQSVAPLAVFYPSTIYVENRPKGLTEYGMAKAAGEELVKDLPKLLPGIRVVSERLPRLATDQTLAVTPQDLPNAIDVLLPVLMSMR
jgi:acyl dehydratase/NAD(P)-dependent dehydrogenase (short-subunit alcohol dehydrogenase family)